MTQIGRKVGGNQRRIKYLNKEGAQGVCGDGLGPIAPTIFF